MDKAESTIQAKPNGVETAPADLPLGGEPARNEGPAAAERLRIHEAGPQPIRASAPLHGAKKPEPPSKPERSGLQRTMGVVRTVLPLVGKALPLLEGNVAAVLANILAPSLQGPSVDLKPLEGGMAKLRADQAAHQVRFEEQTVALKRMGAQIDTVSEAVERHSLEQKELTEEVYSLRRKFSGFAWFGVSLLVVLLAMNVLLLLRVTGVWH
ncbi:MAG TPA: hypothetical protein VK716_16195 [Terracidiphilus sp.]|jgi:hypothetical protein|nr:hypothetical protein [Terracidiphilus sp.]